MIQDTIEYDTTNSRPLPKWLTDQRDGLNTYQPQKLEMKEDRSLEISIISTAFVIVVFLVLFTIWFQRKNKKGK